MPACADRARRFARRASLASQRPAPRGAGAGSTFVSVVPLQPPRARRPDRLPARSRASRTTTPSSATSRRTRSRRSRRSRAARTTCNRVRRHRRLLGADALRRREAAVRRARRRSTTGASRPAPVKPFPPGLRMVAGQLARGHAAEPGASRTGTARSSRRTSTAPRETQTRCPPRAAIPRCSQLREPRSCVVNFPDCWNGRASTAPTTRATWRTRSPAAARRRTRCAVPAITLVYSYPPARPGRRVPLLGRPVLRPRRLHQRAGTSAP